MRLQVVQDSKGKNTGMFIPMEDWVLIKTNYPDVEVLDQDIPNWQKQLLDKRIEAIANNPQSVKSIDKLFGILETDL